MSHFSQIKTQMVEREYLLRALQDLGYTCQEGQVSVRGFGGRQAEVDIKIATANPGYDIGFRRAGDFYEIVADWWGLREMNQEQFQQQVSQRYAYQAARARLEAQGFSLASEEVQADGQIHLVLRRMA